MRSLQYLAATAALLTAIGGPCRADADPLPGLVCANGGPTYVPYAQTEFKLGDVGTPMQRVQLNGPDSRCNDGTPAILYIRPASAYHNGPQLPPNALKQEKWVIDLEGGGGCRDEATCLERWCGLTGIDRASAMSTTDSFEAIPGSHGIFRRDPAINRFAGYNHVFINYCSSDNWIGSGAQALASNGKTYDIEFNGEAIVNDAFARLLDPAGLGPDQPTFWSDILPSLRTADEIVLVGESAGGGGLRHHVDRLREMLVREVYGRARISAVIDAAASPALWDVTAWGGPNGAPTSYQDYLLSVSEPAVRTFWGADDTALDQSCLDAAYSAAHAAIGGSHPQICYDTTYTLFNHITTPFFVREDINDPLQREKYALWQLYPNPPAYWTAQRTLLNTLVGYAGGLEPLTVVPGVFGPNCAQHVTLHSNRFFGEAVRLPGGVMGTTFHDLVDDWMTGLPAAQVQADGIVGPAYTPSFCP
jgi:hypothetical protein